ncbi:MAG: hypothetical protein P8L79_09360 [Rhodospirillaceae bacterium]|jgi:hypothetical protein|nr:hypothetical protein [Rhodospirillaceae bacterium]
MVDFPYENGRQPINTVDYVRIHDQGGTYPFTYRDGRDMLFTFRNNWSYDMQDAAKRFMIGGCGDEAALIRTHLTDSP